MTTNDLQSLIDDEARSIRAFNDHDHTWQDCPQGETVHRRGHYCEHQVQELARHLVANKHPVQQGRIEAARLTDEELERVVRADGRIPVRVRDRLIADAATAKALRVQEARHKALVDALEDAEDWIVAISNAQFPRNLDTLKNIRAALKQEEEA